MTQLVLDDFLPYRLSITSNGVSDYIARAYNALFGLTITEWRLVAVIAETGAITQAAIALRTRMDKVTVSRAAIALVGRGLLAREATPDDRRSHRLILTDAGRSLYAAVAPKALALERHLFANFTQEELAGFTAMLRRIDRVAMDMAPG